MQGRHLILSAILILASTVTVAQQSQLQAGTSSCSFEDGKQITVRYLRPEAPEKEKIFGKLVPFNKLWTPGGQPILMITETDLVVDGATIPAGAYNLYPVPGEKEWKLVFNRPAESGTPYNKNEDVARVTMLTGNLNSPEPHFTVALGRTGANQCSMRMDWEKTRAWVDMNRK